MNRGNVFTNSLFVILSTIIIFIILIIEDYDDLRIGDYVNNISNSEQIFDLIGKERYYPRFLLGRVSLEKGKNYRVGFYDPVLGKEEIISLKYNPGFEFKINTLVEKFRKKKVLAVSGIDNKV
jgi:purine-cytosine permease-like protein